MSQKSKATGMIIGGLALGAIAAVTAAATAHDLKQEKVAKRELHKHKDLVEQKKQYIEHGQIMHYNPMNQTNIAFLGFFNKYLSVYKNGKSEARKDKIGSNEIFTAIPITKDIQSQKDYRCKVCFKLKDSNLFLCAERNGTIALRVGIENVKQWETWIVEQDDKTGMFSFKSHHNKYLCAESNGKAVVNRKKKGDWEKWRIIVIQLPKPKQVKQPTKQKYTNPSQPMVENDGSYY